MRLSEIKKVALVCREAGITPMIWGHKGLGKSSSIKQLCAERGWGVIDYRLSQIEASDLRGLPDKRDGMTVYLPPENMPRGGMSYAEFKEKLDSLPANEKEQFWTTNQANLNEGILFLDEINRANDDVLQGAFELVLDHRIGAHAVAAGWSIVAAGNFSTGYQTNNFNDPAFLSRFCHVTLTSDDKQMEEWVGFIAGNYGEAGSDVVEFCTAATTNLFGKVNVNDDLQLTPDPRSWERVLRIEAAIKVLREQGEEITESVRGGIIRGIVGGEMAGLYLNYSCPVKTKDLITRGVEALRDKLDKLDRGQLVGLTYGVVSYIKPDINRVEKIQDFAIDYGKYLCERKRDKDMVCAYLRNLTQSDGNANASDIRLKAVTSVGVNKMFAAILKNSTTSKTTGVKTFMQRIHEAPSLSKIFSDTANGRS